MLTLAPTSKQSILFGLFIETYGQRKWNIANIKRIQVVLWSIRANFDAHANLLFIRKIYFICIELLRINHQEKKEKLIIANKYRMNPWAINPNIYLVSITLTK